MILINKIDGIPHFYTFCVSTFKKLEEILGKHNIDSSRLHLISHAEFTAMGLFDDCAIEEEFKNSKFHNYLNQLKTCKLAVKEERPFYTRCFKRNKPRRY